MLERYTLPEMLQLWMCKETKFEYWLKVERAVLRARVYLGLAPQEAYEAATAHAKIDVARIETLEKEFEHDMIAFVSEIQESLEAAGAGIYKEEFHKRITSYDIEDPALMLILNEANRLIMKELERLDEILYRRAKEHQWTLMLARTHGQFAEPSTFGHLLLVYREAVRRSILRLLDIGIHELNEAKISGAVGAYGGLDPRIEKTALGYLELRPASAETQILQRDRHATFVGALAIAAGTIEQMCRTFWEMMRSDVAELEEPRGKKQRGSSAMPQKKNPILTERLMGLARVVRGCALSALENIATPECRDISQSSVEREIFPTATGVMHYMARKAAYLVEHLVVFPDRMKNTLEKKSLGVWAAQRVRIALIDAGVPYHEAYEYVQGAAFDTAEKRQTLFGVICHKLLSRPGHDPQTAQEILGREKLGSLFDPVSYIKEGIDHIFRDRKDESFMEDPT